MFLQLQEDVLRAAKLDDSFRWHFSAEKIKENIQKIEDALDRQLMLTRWEECVHISKKKPANKSSYYNQFRALLANLSQKVPEIAEKNFEAQGLSKKKFKDKDEEAKFLATCKDKLEEDLGLKVLEEVKVEEEESFKIKILDDEKFRYKHDQEYISKLGRLKGPKDCEVEDFNNQDNELKTPKVVEEEVVKDPKKKGAAQPDPKKADPKKKNAPGAKKDEEEEVPKIIPKVKITADLIEEKSMEQFLKGLRSIYSRTPKLLMVLVTLEDAEALGTDPDEISIKFLEEKINSYLETKVIFEKNFEIPDWADRLENEVYPEEAVLLFENIALMPEELGVETIVVEEANPNEPASKQKSKKFKCLYDHIKKKAKMLSNYTQSYLYDDTYNFGKRERMTNVYIRPDFFVFGRYVYERISFALRFFRPLQGSSLLILGGEYTLEKLMFLQASMTFFQTIILTGKLGLSFARWTTNFSPDLKKTPKVKDQIFRSLLSMINDKKITFIYPEDVVTITPPPPKEEVSVPDPKKKPAPGAKEVKEESAEEPSAHGPLALLKKADLSPEELAEVDSHAQNHLFRRLDLERVGKYEEAQKADLEERHRREEAAKAEAERLRKEEEAKDPKKKGAAAKDTKPPAADKKAPQGSQAVVDPSKSEIPPLPDFPPFLSQEEQSQPVMKEEMIPLRPGDNTVETLLNSVKSCNTLLWIGATSFDNRWNLSDKKLSKLIKDRRNAANAEEATLGAEARERYIGFKVGVVGSALIKTIDSFDLKDPPPPKVKKVRDPDAEEGEEGDDLEEEEGEEEEEEEFDDDEMSSAEIRRIRKKHNIDQITEIYTEDEKFFLKLFSGEYIEELDKVDQAKKIVINPDDVDFPYLAEI